MKIINYRPKRRKNRQKSHSLQRGQIWQPKDPAGYGVVISSVSDDRVFLQYADNLQTSFVMDKSVFLKYYNPTCHRLSPSQDAKWQEQPHPFFA